MKVIMLNTETFPPEPDITKASLFVRARHATASSGFVILRSLIISLPVAGRHNSGRNLTVAYKNKRKLVRQE